MIFALLFCKLMILLLTPLGRGSSFPGSMALRIYPNILKKMKLPEQIIAVTGSNGKTSTTEFIYEVAKATKKKVISNHEGSNQIDGVVTLFVRHSNIFGKVKADIAIIESDERYCQYTFKYFTPHVIVITNLFRDQMTRNGHNEFVYDELKKGLPAFSVLVLNADDPLTASFAEGREQVIYFGIDPFVFPPDDNPDAVVDDGKYCPVCGGLMKYEYRLINHLGQFRCMTCEFSRKRTSHEITSVTKDKLTADGMYDIKPQMMNSMFAANIIAAFTVGVESIALPAETVTEVLDGYILKNDRLKKYGIGEHKGIFMLSKHENIMSYNVALQNIIRSRSKKKTVVVIFDLLSRRYIANDISWIWDIDFELLNREQVAKVIVSGAFAEDLAVRMIFAGISEERLLIVPDIGIMTESLGETAEGEIFVMTCFTDVKKFTSRLKGGGK